jgi:hypothetical protein
MTPFRIGETDERFWHDWDAVVHTYGTNACYLSNFVRYYAQGASGGGWTPEFICQPTGVAALMVHGWFGIRTAIALLSPTFGAEPVIDPKSGEEFVRDLLDCVFGTLRCQVLDLNFPNESLTLAHMKDVSNSMRLKLEQPSMKPQHATHSVLPVDRTWNEYERMRGYNFTHHFRKIEKKLDQAGRWSIRRLPIENQDIVDKINEVESHSWKSSWRQERGITFDFDLTAFLDFRKFQSENEPPIVWLLELDERPIAFEIGMILNKVALLCKTSYDERHANLYCGVFVNNYAIRDLFESGGVSVIDFLTPLEYHERWTSLRPGRTRMVVTKPVPVVTPVLSFIQKSEATRAIIKRVRG